MKVLVLCGLAVLLLTYVLTANTEEIIEMCKNLQCDTTSNLSVCGIKYEASGIRLKIFENECALLQHGCSVGNEDAFGMIGVEYCLRKGATFYLDKRAPIIPESHKIAHRVEHEENDRNNKHVLPYRDDKLIMGPLETLNTECNICNDSKEQVCGIRRDGEGYRIKLFENKCELAKFNCYTETHFILTDMFVCEGSFRASNNSIDSKINAKDDVSYSNKYTKLSENFKSLIVVDGSMLGRTTDVNNTIENFFAATHVLDLPIREIDEKELKTRRMLLKIAGPVKVFQPWITIPKKIETDYYHRPLLSTCYHKCPTYCPDTYAPVCGVPGIRAREPSIMFQNHCYMDVAQCKMYWENKSSTAITSSYIESSFLFCLGDQLNGLYRFLPLIRTLQHMGRLKKKGQFRYRMKNMRFFNNYAYKEPKIMG